MAFSLSSKGIITREDLAELATDDLLEIIDDLSKDEAAAIIMKARAHWFEED